MMTAPFIPLACGLLASAIALHAAGQQAPPSPRSGSVISTEVRAACDAAYKVAAGTPGVSIRRRAGEFRDEVLKGPVPGCGMVVSGSFKRAEATGDAAERLRNDFARRGWQEQADYSADGVDGTSFAFARRGVSCLVRGDWDGGADDPEIPPLDWYRVTLFCTTPVLPPRF